MSEEHVSTETTEQVDTQEQVDIQTERTFTRADIGKMIAAERAKWESEQAKALEEAKSEGERLAKLTKDQRLKEEQDKRLKELETREQELAMKELKIEARSLLSEEGLPTEFLEMVMGDTAEVVKTNISNLRSVFDAAVEKRVDERLTQSKVRTGLSSGAMSKADILAVPNRDERERLIAEHIDLFRK